MTYVNFLKSGKTKRDSVDPNPAGIVVDGSYETITQYSGWWWMIVEWIPCYRELPLNDIFVETKIDDEKGCRNQQIMRRDKNLWFVRDGTYVYYSPTHWRWQPVEEYR